MPFAWRLYINQQYGNEETPENTNEACYTSVEFTSWEETVSSKIKMAEK